MNETTSGGGVYYLSASVGLYPIVPIIRFNVSWLSSNTHFTYRMMSLPATSTMASESSSLLADSFFSITLLKNTWTFLFVKKSVTCSVVWRPQTFCLLRGQPLLLCHLCSLCCCHVVDFWQVLCPYLDCRNPCSLHVKIWLCFDEPHIMSCDPCR